MSYQPTLREFEQIHDDGSRSPVWLNGAHIMQVEPAGGGTSMVATYVIRRDGVILSVRGYAGDVARTLDGYFDE